MKKPLYLKYCQRCNKKTHTGTVKYLGMYLCKKCKKELRPKTK